MKYKAAILVLAAAMAIGFSACGKTADSEAGSETTTETTATEDDGGSDEDDERKTEDGSLSVSLPEEEWQQSDGSSSENGISSYSMPVDSGKIILNTREFSGASGEAFYKSIITDERDYKKKVGERADDELLEFDGGVEQNGTKYCFTVIKHTDPETYEVQFSVTESRISENGSGYTAQAAITGAENEDKLDEVKDAVKSVRFE